MLSEGRIALKFDLTSIPQGATVTKATFSFYRTTNHNGYDGNGEFNICLINKDWKSSSATWNNLASSYDEEIIASQDYSRGTNNEWFDFNVTEAVSDMVVGQSENYGFMAFVDCNVSGNTGGHISLIHSSEASDDDLQPKLVVEYSGTPIVSEMVKNSIAPLTISYSQTGNIQVTTNTDGKYSILFHTGNGRLIGQIDNKNLKAGINTIYCGNLNLTRGLIVITLKNGGHIINSKAVIN